jgi:hypothetical protein
VAVSADTSTTGASMMWLAGADAVRIDETVRFEETVRLEETV